MLGRSWNGDNSVGILIRCVYDKQTTQNDLALQQRLLPKKIDTHTHTHNSTQNSNKNKEDEAQKMRNREWGNERNKNETASARIGALLIRGIFA